VQLNSPPAVRATAGERDGAGSDGFNRKPQFLEPIRGRNVSRPKRIVDSNLVPIGVILEASQHSENRSGVMYLWRDTSEGRAEGETGNTDTGSTRKKIVLSLGVVTGHFPPSEIGVTP
jgi:hypothetical protein